MTQDNIESPQFEAPRRAEDFHNLTRELTNRGLNILDAKENAADQRREAIQYLKDTYNLNGQAERVIEDLELFHQEAEAKKEWSTWDYIKYPFAKTWEVMKAHPYLSTAAIIATAGAGAYYTGALTPVVAAVKQWLVQLGVGGAAEAVTETVGAGVEVAKDAVASVAQGAEALIDKVPVPDMVPGAVDAAAGAGEVAAEASGVLNPTTTVPSIDEAAKILDALRQAP